MTRRQIRGTARNWLQATVSTALLASSLSCSKGAPSTKEEPVNVANAQVGGAARVSAGEVASLREEVRRLKQELKAQDGEVPSREQEEKFLRAREDALEKQIAGARVEDGTEERRLIQQALDAADRESPSGPNAAAGGAIESFDCYPTICRCRTKHASEKAYMAFTRAAFSGVNGPPDAGDTPRLFRGWYTITEAGPKDGGFKTLFYVGRLSHQENRTSREVRSLQ